MNKITPQDKESKSQDLVQENISQLKQLFPEIVSEGKVDFEVLQEILGEEVIEDEEYYKFTWAGKAKARREANKPSTGTLRPAKEESLNWDKTNNLYIEGDNLEVLKLMQKSYAGKIKMIYIDPPYNTGKDFVYKDNYKDNLKNYQELTGQVDSEGRKMTTNTESEGRFHSNWLNMMYPRLRLARNLLSDDGVIFMSIDDNEVENLKKIGNEVFGEDNYISDFIWRKKAGGGQADDFFVTEHEHIIVYKKSSHFSWKDQEVLDDIRNYNKKDDEGSYKLVKLAKWGNTARRVDRPSMYFPLRDPNGNDNFPVAPDGNEGRWRVGKDKLKKLLDDNLIHWEIKNKVYVPYEKIYFDSNKIKKNKTRSIIYNVAQTGDGSNTLTKLFGNKDIFENPKPIELINEFIQYNLLKNEMLLDFFSGSATSAHAIMALNAEDGGNRKHIQVQLPEPTDEKSEAYKAGYKKLTDIGKERIRRAGKQILEDLEQKIQEQQEKLQKLKDKEAELTEIDELDKEIKKLKTRKENFDVGFKVFKLDSSNIKAWSGSTEDLKENLLSQVENIKTDRSQEDVLYEILIKFGIDLTAPILTKSIDNKTIYTIGYGALFVCLDDEITVDIAKAIGEWKNELDPEKTKVVFRDAGLDDVTKTNAIQILKQFEIAEVRSI